MCVMAFDKHNVVNTMDEEQTSRFAVLKNKVQYYNNLGGALALISRGPNRWEDVKVRAWNQEGYTTDGDVRPGHEPIPSFQRYTLFYQVADFFIFTTNIDHQGPLEVYRKSGMEHNMVCISGDKGDAAR